MAAFFLQRTLQKGKQTAARNHHGKARKPSNPFFLAEKKKGNFLQNESKIPILTKSAKRRKETVMKDTTLNLDMIRSEHFGPLYRFVQDPDVTDINYNGKDLWIDDLKKGSYKVDMELDDSFIAAFSTHMSNVVNQNFNKTNPLLEGETKDLRISILHESVSNTGRSICIRKTPVQKRYTGQQLIESNYCSQEILSLLINSVIAKISSVYCGVPGAGKTELLKYLTAYIPDNEKTITIEDNLEIHYNDINPFKNGQEIRVSDIFSYEDALKACLRMQPTRILLSEARSREVKYLLEALSVGTSGMTTIHVEDVRKIPDRIVSMVGDNSVKDRTENDVYNFLDMGVLLSRKVYPDRIERKIEQVGFYYRKDDQNQQFLCYNNGIINRDLPEEIMEKYKKAGIINPFEYRGMIC